MDLERRAPDIVYSASPCLDEPEWPGGRARVGTRAASLTGPKEARTHRQPEYQQSASIIGDGVTSDSGSTISSVRRGSSRAISSRFVGAVFSCDCLERASASAISPNGSTLAVAPQDINERAIAGHPLRAGHNFHSAHATRKL